jgi:hypothetical protein
MAVVAAEAAGVTDDSTPSVTTPKPTRSFLSIHQPSRTGIAATTGTFSQ